MPVIPALGILSEENCHKSKTSLNYIDRPHLKKNKNSLMFRAHKTSDFQSQTAGHWTHPLYTGSCTHTHSCTLEDQK